jgi:tRNA A-37 threonylcarbamoyl transferase component Bud32
MGRDIKVFPAPGENRQWLQEAAGFAFSRYDGRRSKWQIDDDESLWKINIGARAGVAGVSLQGRVGCVKLFYDDRFHVKLRNRLGFSKARRALEKGLELERRAINCPKMIGWALDGQTSLALLITELASDAQRIDLWIKDNPVSIKFIKELAVFVRNIHDAGCGHNDLSLRNILFECRDGDFVFYLLDYEDVVFKREIDFKRRIKDLHHICERALNNTTLRQRMYFLKHYLGGTGSLREWAVSLNEYMMKNPSKYSKGFLKSE